MLGHNVHAHLASVAFAQVERVRVAAAVHVGGVYEGRDLIDLFALVWWRRRRWRFAVEHGRQEAGLGRSAHGTRAHELHALGGGGVSAILARVRHVDGKARLLAGARVATGETVAEAVEAERHGRVRHVVVDKLAPLHQHERVPLVARDRRSVGGDQLLRDEARTRQRVAVDRVVLGPAARRAQAVLVARRQEATHGRVGRASQRLDQVVARAVEGAVASTVLWTQVAAHATLEAMTARQVGEQLQLPLCEEQRFGLETLLLLLLLVVDTAVGGVERVDVSVDDVERSFEHLLARQPVDELRRHAQTKHGEQVADALGSACC